MQNVEAISRDMDVFGSDGRRLGSVRKVAGSVILLGTSERGEVPLSIPRSWITEVNGVVRLAKPSVAVRQIWRSA